MKERLYLDNCSFNRPYDDQLLLKNYLEAEAKTYIQKEILQGTFELAWSYILDYEISFNPFLDRKNQNILHVQLKHNANILLLPIERY